MIIINFPVKYLKQKKKSKDEKKKKINEEA